MSNQASTACLFLALIALSFPGYAQNSLTTSYGGGFFVRGQFFDIEATTTGINIQTLDLNLQAGSRWVYIYAAVDGVSGSSIYYDSSKWSLVASQYVTSNGPGVPTPFPEALDIAIPLGGRQGFYVHVDEVSAQRISPSVGLTVTASDANINVWSGPYVLNAPFTQTLSFSTGIWNGTIHYNTDSGTGALTNAIVDLPFVEDFDQLIHGSTVPPAGWFQSIIDATGTNSNWWFRSSSASTGTSPYADHTTGIPGSGIFAHIEDSSNYAQVEIFSPAIQLNLYPVVWLRFWVYSLNGNPGGVDSNVLHVDIGNNYGTQSTLDIIPPIGALPPGWHEFKVNLSPYKSYGNARISFRGSSNGGGTLHDICIDDFMITGHRGSDLSILSIDSPIVSNACGAPNPSNVSVTIRCEGAGLTPLFTPGSGVRYRINGGAWETQDLIALYPGPFDGLSALETVQIVFPTLVDFSLPGNYLIEAEVVDPPSGAWLDPSNNSISMLIQSPAAAIVAPWSETFDSLTGDGGTMPPAGWINDSADALPLSGNFETDWRFRSNDTPSSGTGAPVDHTTGISGAGHYAYVEDSSGHWPNVRLLTPCVDLTPLSSPCLTFWVHSVNSSGSVGMNFLHIDIMASDGQITVDAIPPVAALQTGWRKFIVSLASYEGQSIRAIFRVDSTNAGTNSFTHDICVDDVSIAEGPAGSNEDFELAVYVSGAPQTNDFLVAAAPAGTFLSLVVDSPNGTFWGVPPIVAGEIFLDGVLPAYGALIPEFHIGGLGFLIFDGSVPTQFGPTVLGPLPVGLNFVVPSGLNPFTLRVQGLLLSGSAANFIYATTNAVDINLF